jgi:hypothetical protein
MQLYKLADEYAAAVRNLESLFDAGEIDHGTLSDTMESMVGDVKDKAVNVALHIKNLRSDLAQLEEAKATFNARIKAAESAVEFFEQYLDANMKKSGIAELKTAEVLVKYKKLPAIVDITGEVPEGFQRVIPEKREPDKRAIGDALKAGQVLDFAALIEGRTKLEVK